MTVKCSANLQGQREEQVSFMGMRLSVIYDKCPIRTAPISVTALVRTNKGFLTLDQFISKGGNFDTKNCQNTPAHPLYGWSGTPAQNVETETCSLDEGMSIEKIEKIVDDYKTKNLVRNKKVIKMNFNNFVSE